MKRDSGLDFARMCGVLGIVMYHYYCHSHSAILLIWGHANGVWGDTLNHLFFALSGLVIHQNYGKRKPFNVLSFYGKRAKALLPMFWIGYAVYCATGLVLQLKTDFSAVPPINFLWTVLGLDGYMAAVTPTFHLIGEWFLGAIIVAYAVYPLLRLSTRKLKYPMLALLVLLFGFFGQDKVLGFPVNISPLTCILSFYTGMVMSDFVELLKKWYVTLGAAVCCALLFLVPFGAWNVSKDILCGIILLIALYGIGTQLCRLKAIRLVTDFVSRLSYPIFLVHHALILLVQHFYNPTDPLVALGVLLCVLALTFVTAAVLDLVTKFVLNLFSRSKATAPV